MLLAFMLSAWHTLILYPDVSRYYVKISVKSSILDMAKLYYDRGSGLNESDSRSIALAGDDRFHDYLFMIPNVTIKHLRFDPPSVAGDHLTISHLALVDSSENLLQIINLDQLRPANQIKSFDLYDSKLVIVTGDKADDPQIDITLPKPFKPSYFRPLLLHLYGQIFLEFLILCGIIWMLTGLIGTLGKKDPRIAALLIAVILLCGWRCWILYKDHSSAYVNISIKSNAFGTIQLFYDTGYWFVDADSVKSALWGDNVYHHYRFNLPNLPIYAFRFDPLTHGGVIAVKNIQIMDGSGRLLHSIDAKIIKPLEQIIDFRLQNQELVFETGGEGYGPKFFIPLEKPLSMNRIITLADVSFLFRILLEFIIFACLYFLLSFLIKKMGASIRSLDRQKQPPYTSTRRKQYLIKIKLLLRGGQEFRFDFKKIDLKILPLIIVIGFFWMVVFLERNTTLELLGHFNYFPPRISVDKFKQVLLQGSIMEELATLCKINAPDSVGLSWPDYEKIVTMTRYEYNYSYMMFEKFFELYQCPVRLKPEEIGRMKTYITFFEQTKLSIPIAKTSRFGLFKTDAR
jgi:hypothetical protein